MHTHRTKGSSWRLLLLQSLCVWVFTSCSLMVTASVPISTSRTIILSSIIRHLWSAECSLANTLAFKLQPLPCLFFLTTSLFFPFTLARMICVWEWLHGGFYVFSLPMLPVPLCNFFNKIYHLDFLCLNKLCLKYETRKLQPCFDYWASSRCGCE